MTNDIIIMGGKGQVGQALDTIMREQGLVPQILDIDTPDPTRFHCSAILHVCIRYSETFVEEVRRVAEKYNATLIIIHSTLPVGTTRKFGANAVHSPIRGQHHDLKSAIQRFKKYVAGVTPEATQRAAEHLRNIGLNVHVWEKPEETELMKLLCLARFLNDIAFYEFAYKTCLKFDVPTYPFYSWTESYNEGYAKTGFERPNLNFPFGHIGGHCVMPGTKMLYEQTADPWLKKSIDLFVKGESNA
jgi:hypothetical protein